MIASAEMIDRLCLLDDSPWTDYNFRERDIDRRRIQSRQVSNLLRDYKIAPGTIRLSGGSTPKGYKRIQFETAWARYLPIDTPVPAATPPQSSNGAGSSESLSATREKMWRIEKPWRPTTARVVALWRIENP